MAERRRAFGCASVAKTVIRTLDTGRNNLRPTRSPLFPEWSAKSRSVARSGKCAPGITDFLSKVFVLLLGDEY
jgi:hypothetical protein